MKKQAIKHLDLDLYQETLPNGLRIFVIPKNNVNNVYVTFSTKYGSADNEFVPLKEQDMIEVPKGVAHFLEHKMFAQKDGVDPLSFFTMRGASGNANTSNFKTTYLFSGSDYLEENLNYLLDYVQDPYFTDENVESEKGIITQEINMYKDNPYTEAFESLMLNCFKKLPIRYNVLGSVDSIQNITKEDLYRCYKTFYHPSNMFVVITGNVDTKEVIDIIKENQAKKTFPEKEEIKRKTYLEPKEVVEKELVMKRNIAIPKLLLAFKIKFDDIPLKNRIIRYYLSMYSQMKFGNISAFLDKLKADKIITSGMGVSLVSYEKDAALIYDAETYKPNELKRRMLKEINLEGLSEEDFNRKKKSFLASAIYLSDNIFRLNDKIMSDIIEEDVANTDVYDEIKNLNYQEFLKVMESISFAETTSVVIKPE